MNGQTPSRHRFLPAAQKSTGTRLSAFRGWGSEGGPRVGAKHSCRPRPHRATHTRGESGQSEGVGAQSGHAGAKHLAFVCESERGRGTLPSPRGARLRRAGDAARRGAVRGRPHGPRPGACTAPRPLRAPSAALYAGPAAAAHLSGARGERVGGLLALALCSAVLAQLPIWSGISSALLRLSQEPEEEEEEEEEGEEKERSSRGRTPSGCRAKQRRRRLGHRRRLGNHGRRGRRRRGRDPVPADCESPRRGRGGGKVGRSAEPGEEGLRCAAVPDARCPMPGARRVLRTRGAARGLRGKGHLLPPVPSSPDAAPTPDLHLHLYRSPGNLLLDPKPLMPKLPARVC